MLAALVGAALAQAPLGLPPGESCAAWESSARAAGLGCGLAPVGARAEVLAAGDRWVLRVLDRAGLAHDVVVDIATTPEARASLCWLAASLLRPTPALALPALAPDGRGSAAPPPSRVPAARPPSPARVEPPPPGAPAVEPEPAAEVLTPGDREPAEPAPTAPAPGEAPLDPSEAEGALLLLDLPLTRSRPLARQRLTGWFQAAATAQARAETTLQPRLHLALGLRLAEIDLGLGAAWSGNATLQQAGEGREMAARDLLAHLQVGRRTTTSGLLVFQGGIRQRSFNEGGLPVLTDQLPLVGLQAGANFPALPTLTLLPTLSLLQELGTTELVVDGEAAGQLAPTTLGFQLAFQLNPAERREVGRGGIQKRASAHPVANE